MDDQAPASSQRPVPVASPDLTLVPPSGRPQSAALCALWESHGAEPVELLRSRDGRTLSRARCRRAEEFMLPLALGALGDWPDFLYGAGIVAQLALSSHLLDVGFPDAWCARHIGLYVARSLAFANATGLGLECAATARLALVLSPYSKWNCRSVAESPSPIDGGFSYDETRMLLRALVDHVADVTGHRPRRSLARRRFLEP